MRGYNDGVISSGALHPLLHAARKRLLLAAFARQLAWRLAVLLAIAVVAGILQDHLVTPLCLLAGVILVAHGILTFRIPSRLHAALELDRQFALDELLSTALSAEGNADPFARAVTVKADQVASMLDVHQLNAGSYGTRAWVAALLLAGILPIAYRRPVPSADSSTVNAAEIASQPTPHSTANRFHPFLPHLPTLTREPVRTGVSSDASAIAAEQPVHNPTHAAPDHSGRSDLPGESNGAGLAQGPSAPAPNVTPLSAVSHQQGGDVSSDTTGTAEANPDAALAFVHSVGQVATAQAQHTGAQSGPASANPGSVPDPHARQLPEAYRDVIRAYLDR